MNIEPEPFATIDDVLGLVSEATRQLQKLASYKYPLGVRKGVRIMQSAKNHEKGEMIKGAGRTYFFDVRKTKDGKSFLTIAESKKDENGKFVRNSIAIFPEDKKEFAKLVTENLAEI